MSGAAVPWLESLAAVGVASAVPLLATWWLASRPALTAALVSRLILLAAGALLGAAAFHLIPEALVRSGGGRVTVMVGLGILALAALERAIHAMERPQEAHSHAPLGERAHLMPLGIASDALHNTIDGALIATAFLADSSLGVFAGVAIALHELPRELGTFALCVAGGMSPRRAILVNAATGVLALLGAVLALLVGDDAQRFGQLLLPFAAGNFLYLAAAILVAHGVRGPVAASAAVARPASVHVHGHVHAHPEPHPHGAPLSPRLAPAGTGVGRAGDASARASAFDPPMVRWGLVAAGIALTALLSGGHA